jgi:hypothetical protein
MLIFFSPPLPYPDFHQWWGDGFWDGIPCVYHAVRTGLRHGQTTPPPQQTKKFTDWSGKESHHLSDDVCLFLCTRLKMALEHAVKVESLMRIKHWQIWRMLYWIYLSKISLVISVLVVFQSFEKRKIIKVSTRQFFEIRKSSMIHTTKGQSLMKRRSFYMMKPIYFSDLGYISLRRSYL